MGTSRVVPPRFPFSSRTSALGPSGWRIAPIAAVVTVTLASVLIASPPAHAADRASLEEEAHSADARRSAESLYELAEREDEAGAYARAIADYRASVASLPSNRYAPRAIARAAILEAHSEGNFAPYAELERVRRDPVLASDVTTIDTLARDADAFPPGLVRVEARMVCADAYLNRLARPADGIRLLRQVMADEKTDPLTQRQAAHALVDAFVTAGDLDEAEALLRTNTLDSKLAHHVRSLVRRRTLRASSIAVLVALFVLASASLAMTARRGALSAIARALRSSAPLALGFAAYVGIAGSALAAGYEHGDTKPFVIMGGVLFPLILVARAWGAAGRPSRVARIGRGVLAASSVVAAGFLVLEWIDAAYLESFGL